MANNDYINKIKSIGTNVEVKKEIIYFDESKPKKIIKAINGEDKIPDIVFLSELLYKEVFKNSADIIDMPIEAIRVILTMLHYSKELHFNQPNAPYTPSLFEEEFLTSENSYISVSVPNAIISPSRETKRIKDALDVLTTKTSRWVSAKNIKGETVQSLISFIERPSYTRGKVKFEISSYWVEKLANIQHYNKFIFELVYKIPNTRHLVFAIWLNTLPVYKGDQLDKETYKSWTRISVATFQEKFGLSEKDHNYIRDKFLKPLQKKLFQLSDKSFAFRYEKGLFYITAIHVKSNAITEGLNVVNSYEVQVKYAVAYLQKRHRLDSPTLKHIEVIYRNSPKDKELMETAYKNVVRKIRMNKKKMVDLKPFELIDLWQEEIVGEYSKTERYKSFPDGYPKINTAH